MIKKLLRIVWIYTFLLIIMIPMTKIFAQYAVSKKWLFNGHEYQLIFESVSWSEAKEYCESVGGHLVTFDTSDEYEFVKNKVYSGNNWIGAYANGNVIKWVDGSNVDENVINFSFGEPSYLANYFTLDADDNYFDRSYPGRGFICEWDDSKIVNDLICEELATMNIECPYTFIGTTYSDVKNAFGMPNVAGVGEVGGLIGYETSTSNILYFIVNNYAIDNQKIGNDDIYIDIPDDALIKGIVIGGEKYDVLFKDIYSYDTISAVKSRYENKASVSIKYDKIYESNICSIQTNISNHSTIIEINADKNDNIQLLTIVIEGLETPLYKQKQIKVILNGTTLAFDQPPILDPAGRVLVPIRKIAEAMGDNVKWNQDLQTAFVQHKERALIIPLYTDHLYMAYSDKPVEWRKYDLDVPSQVQNGRTLTPVRAFCESLGATVNWNDRTQTVYIEYNGNYNYDSLSDETINGINMAYSIMRNHNNISFEKYSEEIYAYLENSNSAIDNAVMSWGSGLFDGIVQLLSGEDATETTVKASLAQVISLLDDINRSDDNAEVIDGITYTKNGVDTLNTLLTLPKENLTINSIDDLEQLTDSVPQIKALSKHLEAFEIFAFGTQEICYLLADYAQNITYLDNIEKYFMATSAGNDLLYKVIDDMKDEYTKKWIHSLTSLRDKGIDAVLSTLADTATGGVFGIVNFAKYLTNELTGLSTSAKGLKEFYASCILNVAFDEAYYDMMEDVSGIHFHSDEMIDMFNMQRAVKATTYMSMNKIANSVDEVFWDDRIDELENASYILWK